MNRPAKVSICIPYRATDERRARYFEWNVSRWRCLTGDDDRYELIVGDAPRYPFNRAAARNAAAELATGDVFVFVDADTIVSIPVVVSSVVTAVNGVAAVQPFDVYYNLTEAASDAATATDSTRLSFPTPADDDWEHRLTDSPGGCVIVSRDVFEKVGGWCEKFVGWGYEDDAFLSDLAQAGEVRRVAGNILHLWHPAPEAERFGQPHAAANRLHLRAHRRGQCVRSA